MKTPAKSSAAKSKLPARKAKPSPRVKPVLVRNRFDRLIFDTPYSGHYLMGSAQGGGETTAYAGFIHDLTATPDTCIMRCHEGPADMTISMKAVPRLWLYYEGGWRFSDGQVGACTAHLIIDDFRLALIGTFTWDNEPLAWFAHLDPS